MKNEKGFYETWSIASRDLLLDVVDGPKFRPLVTYTKKRDIPIYAKRACRKKQSLMRLLLIEKKKKLFLYYPGALMISAHVARLVRHNNEFYFKKK